MQSDLSDLSATLLTEYLSRPNANTKAQYAAAVADFTKFLAGHSSMSSGEAESSAQPAQSISSSEAVATLLGGGFASSNRIVTEYRTQMEGTLNKKGVLVSGRGLSAAAINLRLTVLRGLVKMARRYGYIDWDIDVPNVAAEQVHNVAGPGLTILNRMLEAARATPGPVGRRNYAILRLAGELGLRRKEIVGLDLSDFEDAESTVAIKGKGRREKERLSCTPELADAIFRWIEVRPRPLAGSPLFTNLMPGRVGRLTGNAVWQIVHELGKGAVPKGSRTRVRPHGIRHTAITEAVRRAAGAGVNREDVKQFSRHKDFRMVSRYIDAHDAAQKKLGTAVGSALK